MNEPETRKDPAAAINEAATPGKANETPAGDAPVPTDQLTKEEQWALFEKELKESDWGHQPC